MTEDAPGPAEATKPTFTTPEMAALQRETEAIRAELAATVDQLTARLDPRAQADRLATDARRLVSDATDAGADPDARRRARIVLGVAGGVLAVTLAVVIRKIVR